MKIESYQIGDWEDLETGVLLDENDDWVLIKYIPNDYQLDGYKLLSKAHIEDRFEAENSAVIKKVLDLKKVTIQKPADFKFRSTLETLKWVENKFGCFEFQDKEEELHYGVLESFNVKEFEIDAVNSKGNFYLDFYVMFEIKDVKVITFESGYFNSINLLYNYNKENKA